MNPPPSAAIRPPARVAELATSHDVKFVPPHAAMASADPDENAMLAALCEGIGLTCVFQPILDFRTSGIAGYEGLCGDPPGLRSTRHWRCSLRHAVMVCSVPWNWRAAAQCCVASSSRICLNACS